MRITRWFHVEVLLAVVMLGVAGCGGRDVPIVAIEGQLTFGGAPPPAGGKIMFSPAETNGSGIPARPGYAKFDTDGVFTVTTYQPGDGLIPGKYYAKILCFRETPTLSNQDEVSYVPKDFVPEVTVPSDVSSLELKLDAPTTRLAKAAKQ
jgi:hypothetical protein